MFIRRFFENVLFSPLTFKLFQKFGINLTKNNCYSPIPDIRAAKADHNIWQKEFEFTGVRMDGEKQLYLLDNVFTQFKHECVFSIEPASNPHEYYANNGIFGLTSASVLHCFIRHFKPATVMEIGSGQSSFVSARALEMNRKSGHGSALVCVEPYPMDVLKQGFDGHTRLVEKKAEELGVGFFERLKPNDILFIDSSHVSKIGGDVNFIYLELLPKLNNGVIVHVHDIFFPKNYPEHLVVKKKFFANEQYLLHAFLINNADYEILWCTSYVNHKYPGRINAVLPAPKGMESHESYYSNSFWMKKRN